MCADLWQFDWTIFVSPEGMPDEVCDGKRKSSRCDMGETPLWGDSFCYYCNQVARFTPTGRPVCSKKWGDRKRICPCRDATPQGPQQKHRILANNKGLSSAGVLVNMTNEKLLLATRF